MYLLAKRSSHLNDGAARHPATRRPSSSCLFSLVLHRESPRLYRSSDTEVQTQSCSTGCWLNSTEVVHLWNRLKLRRRARVYMDDPFSRVSFSDFGWTARPSTMTYSQRCPDRTTHWDHQHRSCVRCPFAPGTCLSANNTFQPRRWI